MCYAPRPGTAPAFSGHCSLWGIPEGTTRAEKLAWVLQEKPTPNRPFVIQITA